MDARLFSLVSWLLMVGLSISDCSSKQQPVQPSASELSDLPYPLGFLEPFMSSQLIYLNHYRHEQADVTSFQSFLTTNTSLLGYPLTDAITQYPRYSEVQNYAGGIYNMRLFWSSLTNSSCALATAPTAPLLIDIQNVWGAFSVFQRNFSREAMQTRGSGWTWLCLSNIDSRLRIMTMSRNQNPLLLPPSTRCFPLLGWSHWEHTYYLQYAYDKASFLSGFWRSLDWVVISAWYQTYVQNFRPVPL